jgi:hypothetical protein
LQGFGCSKKFSYSSPHPSSADSFLSPKNKGFTQPCQEKSLKKCINWGYWKKRIANIRLHSNAADNRLKKSNLHKCPNSEHSQKTSAEYKKKVFCPL